MDEKSNINGLMRYLKDKLSLIKTIEEPEIDLNITDSRDNDCNENNDERDIKIELVLLISYLDAILH